jgi:hypothetical protein
MGKIRWSAVSVSQAADNAAKEIEAIFEPLWKADKTIRDAMEIENLPDYITSRLISIDSEIRRITGVNLQRDGSALLGCIARLRDDIPEGAVEAEQAATRHGKTGSLFG